MTNPLDVGDIYDMSTYPRIIEMMLEEKGIDGVVFVSAQAAEGENEHVENLIREAARMSPAYGKPVVLCTVSSKDRWFSLKEAADIPIFSDVDDALLALSWSLAHSKAFAKKGPQAAPVRRCEGETSGGAGQSWTPATPSQCSPLWPAHRAVRHCFFGRGSRSGAGEIGYPVAVKIASPNLLHKTEKGGVALDLKDAESVTKR